MDVGISKKLEKLKRIQVVDKELYDLRAAVGEIPEILKRQDQAFQAKRAALERAQETLKALLLKQKEKEGELGTQEEALRKHAAQLSKIKTNQEYKALQTEIANLKADASLLEDEILKTMDEAESAKKQVEKEKEILKAEGEALEQAKKALLEERQAKEKCILELEGDREGILADVDRETASVYERILANKGSVALARLDGEGCSECRMVLRPQLINEVQLGEKLILCESCSRILYID